MEKKDHITRRFLRAIFKKSEEVRPRSLSASHVLRPEEVIPERGKRAPKRSAPPTTRRPLIRTKPYIEELPCGVVHMAFDYNLSASPPIEGDTVVARDPVTLRLSRKKLVDGMKKTTGFYDSSGQLFDETKTDW